MDNKERHIPPGQRADKRLTSLTVPEGIIPEGVQDLLSGRIIHWNDPDAPQKTAAALSDPLSRLQRLLTSFNHQNSPGAQEGLRLFYEDLKNLDPDLALMRSDRAQEWLLKISLAIVTDSYLKNSGRFWKDPITNQTTNFSELTANQVNSLASLYSKLGIGDLETYIRLEDIFGLLWEANTKTLKLKRPKIIFERPPFPETNLEEALDSVIDYQRVLFREIMRASEKTWDRLKKCWGWKEIGRVINLLPAIRNHTILTNSLAAIEDNLVSLKIHAVPEDLNLDPEALILLLGKKWALVNAEILQEMGEYYPVLIDPAQRSIQIGESLIPRELTPSVAITLLQKMSQGLDYESFLRFLSKTSQEVAAQKNTTLKESWTLALLSVTKIESVDLGNLLSLSQVPHHLIEALTNQIPGKVIMEQDGKLRLRDSGANTDKGFIVHTSALPPEPKAETSPPTPLTEAPHRPDPRLKEAKTVASLPVVGDVGLGLQNPQELRATIDTAMHHEGFTPDADTLLSEYQALQEGLKPGRLKHEYFDSTIFFNSKLNPNNHAIKQAEHMGIESILIQGQTFFFVFDQEHAYSQLDGRKFPIAIEGSLNRSGELEIAGLDIGDLPQIMLNVIALSLLREDPKQLSANKPNAQQELAEAVREWNRFDRGNLPRISTNGSHPTIAVETSMGTILVSQA